MKIKKLILLIPLCAVGILLTVYAAIWFSGTRYIRYRSADYGNIRFVGKVDSDGVPADGKVYYPDGRKADLSAYESDALDFQDGGSVSGELYLLEYDDDSEYIGQLQGLIPGGDVYEGSFVYGVISGSGSYYYVNGDIYAGDFRDGVKWGEGCYIWAAQGGDSDRYVGEYKNNMRHGKGVYTYADGGSYEGDYEYDAKNGKGIMKFASGDVYEGDFVDDQRSGKGTYTFASGDSYTGDFFRGQITGYGTYHWSSGDRPDYTGYFQNGQIITVEEEQE